MTGLHVAVHQPALMERGEYGGEVLHDPERDRQRQTLRLENVVERLAAAILEDEGAVSGGLNVMEHRGHALDASVSGSGAVLPQTSRPRVTRALPLHQFDEDRLMTREAAGSIPTKARSAPDLLKAVKPRQHEEFRDLTAIMHEFGFSIQSLRYHQGGMPS